MSSIGRYRIVKKLATGGMAEVYLAKVAGPGGFEKHVVVKQILPQLADSELYVGMFLEEARLAATLDHPNIVHVFDFGEIDGSYFLAMEYVEGANLRHVLRWAFKAGHVIAPALAARIVSLSAEGLAYAHHFQAPGTDEVTRLVHRDVSPENIMLARTGAVKLLDFGVAKIASDDHRSKVGSLKGKIAYMPPEQIRGDAIDHRVDIYALGVVLYMSLSGKRPYGQATDVALIQAILNEEPIPLLKHRLDLPDQLLEIVAKAMAKDPDDRFQSADEMRDALDAYIAQERTTMQAAQIAQLVLAYQTATSAQTGNSITRSGLASAAGSGSGVSGASPPRGQPSPPIDNPRVDISVQTTPGIPGPFAAKPADVALDGVVPKTPSAGSEAKSLWPSGWKFGRGTESGRPSPALDRDSVETKPEGRAAAPLADSAVAPTGPAMAVRDGAPLADAPVDPTGPAIAKQTSALADAPPAASKVTAPEPHAPVLPRAPPWATAEKNLVPPPAATAAASAFLAWKLGGARSLSDDVGVSPASAPATVSLAAVSAAAPVDAAPVTVVVRPAVVAQGTPAVAAVPATDPVREAVAAAPEPVQAIEPVLPVPVTTLDIPDDDDAIDADLDAEPLLATVDAAPVEGADVQAPAAPPPPAPPPPATRTSSVALPAMPVANTRPSSSGLPAMPPSPDGAFSWPAETAPAHAPAPTRASAPVAAAGPLGVHHQPPAPVPSAPRPTASAPRAGDEAPQVRSWAPSSVAAEPIRAALRESLRSDRSTYLLRKLPPVIGRLTDFTRTVPWSMIEALAGIVDAALLSDDHTAVARVLDRAAQRPGKDARFSSMVAAELASPLRIAWLVERLRSGLPADVNGLRSWLLRLGSYAGPLFLAGLELSEPGPAQELFAEGLAAAIPGNPGLVLSRLEQPKLRDLSALCFALERSGANERTKVFQRLIGRRDIPIQVEVLAGRARARGADALLLLEGALGDKSDDVRRRALTLIGELGGQKGLALLVKAMKDGGFDAKPTAERAQFWTSMLECGGEAAVHEVEAVLSQRASLLNKKKTNEAKLVVIEGLARAKSEVARTLLEKVAGESSQGDDVLNAARAALDGARRNTGENLSGEHKAIGEWRTHLLARVTLDLVMLSRASTTVDISSGVLDSAVERFREGLRGILAQDGKVHLMATDAGPTLNGAPVSFGPLHDLVTPAVTAALQVRDLQGMALESMLPAGEFRSFFMRAFDPDGRRERLPHIRAINVAGQALSPIAEAPLAADPTARMRELFAAIVRWLSMQRDGLRADRPMDLASVDVALDEWSRLIDAGQARFLGVARWQPSDTGTLVHAANTAMLAMAFAHDLGLSRSAVREVAELSLVLGLAESVVAAERRPPPGEATGEDERFYAAGLVLTNRVNRLGTCAAVGAVEAGMSHASQGRGPGVLASVHALAKAYDSLTAGTGGTSSQALEAMNGKLRTRFSPDLVGLFTQWAFAQAGASN